MFDTERSFRSLPRNERRNRIVWAAKRVFLDKGFDAASMDDVAAAAGATKPTLYAHFKSKDELFLAVVEMIKGLFLEKLRSPDAYAADPAEAIALFCGRFLELICWRDAVVYQRMVLAAAALNPATAKMVYDLLYTEAHRILTTYIHSRKLTRLPEHLAKLLLSASTGEAVLRRLYGVDDPYPDLPDQNTISTYVDIVSIRKTIKLIMKK